MPDDAPRVLYIAFYFPPTRASGVYRSRAVANHLADAGWDVTVMTPQREFFRDYIHSYDPSLEQRVHPDVTVERVPFKGSRWEPDLRRWGALRAHLPALDERFRKVRERWLFPEAYSGWIRPVARRAAALHRRRPFDVVLATGNPHSSFAAAWLLHRRTGVPYVMDYRDAWTLDLYHDRPAYPRYHSAWLWERLLLRGAARADFVNEPIREWHTRRYPRYADRLTVVENGWEPELLEMLPPLEPPGNRPLRLGYLGTLTQFVPLEEFFDGWRLARKEPVLQDAEVHLHGHLGYFRSGSDRVRKVLPLDEGIDVHYGGPVSKSHVADVYASLDILLLMIAGSKYVTSGKVYEYMGTARPIVSVHDPACAASSTLRGYPLWFPVRSLDPASVRDALVDAAHAVRDLTATDVAAARDHAARFTRDAQLVPLERGLRKIIGRGGRS